MNREPGIRGSTAVPCGGMRSVRELVVALAAVVLTACAPDGRAGNVGNADQLVSELKRIRPGAEIGKPHATPIPGVVGVDMPGGNVIYGTSDGNHVIAGDLYALETDLVNLTERRRVVRRRDRLAGMDVSGMIVFPAPERDMVLNVFTDVDCAYCRLLQEDMDQLNAEGIEVRYLAYPRAGIESSSYRHMVSAWCADDPAAALREVLGGGRLPTLSCDNPVADHYALAKELGLPGTPGIVTSDGRLVSGYVSLDKLLQSLRG